MTKVQKTLTELELLIHEISSSKGWDFDPQNQGVMAEKLLLVHSEISEAVEWHRTGNPQSDHIPMYSGMEEELADVIIRVLHITHKMKFDIGGAIIAKLNFNNTRPYKHGNKKY